MRLTRETIGTTIAQHGRFNHNQLAMLGISWPPQSGWIDSLIGLTVPDSKWDEILKLKQPKPKPDNQLSLFAPASVVAPTHKIEVYFDGGCHGNPGLKYGSFEILLDGRQIAGRSRVDFGHGTNNEAEFDALQMGLDELAAHCSKTGLEPSQCSLMVETDSTIVKNRLVKKNVIMKKYPRSAVMFAMATRCLEVMKKFGSYDVTWKRRDANVERFGH